MVGCPCVLNSVSGAGVDAHVYHGGMSNPTQLSGYAVVADVQRRLRGLRPSSDTCPNGDAGGAPPAPHAPWMPRDMEVRGPHNGASHASIEVTGHSFDTLMPRQQPWPGPSFGVGATPERYTRDVSVRTPFAPSYGGGQGAVSTMREASPQDGVTVAMGTVQPHLRATAAVGTPSAGLPTEMGGEASTTTTAAHQTAASPPSANAGLRVARQQTADGTTTSHTGPPAPAGVIPSSIVTDTCAPKSHTPVPLGAPSTAAQDVAQTSAVAVKPIAVVVQPTAAFRQPAETTKRAHPAPPQATPAPLPHDRSETTERGDAVAVATSQAQITTAVPTSHAPPRDRTTEQDPERTRTPTAALPSPSSSAGSSQPEPAWKARLRESRERATAEAAKVADQRARSAADIARSLGDPMRDDPTEGRGHNHSATSAAAPDPDQPDLDHGSTVSETLDADGDDAQRKAAAAARELEEAREAQRQAAVAAKAKAEQDKRVAQEQRAAAGMERYMVMARAAQQRESEASNPLATSTPVSSVRHTPSPQETGGGDLDGSLSVASESIEESIEEEYSQEFSEQASSEHSHEDVAMW